MAKRTKKDPVEARLAEVGAVFLRQTGSHKSYRLPNGRSYSYSCSSKGPYARKQALRELERKLKLGEDGHPGARGA